MIGKYLLPVRTAFALKSNNAIRISGGYRESQKIGVIYTYYSEKEQDLVCKLLDKLEAEGKTVKSIAFITDFNKNEEYRFPHFCLKDVDTFGSWNKSEVEEFCKETFDYLINIDLKPNKVTENILAQSKSKCRVGRFVEGKSEFFELMIDHKEENPNRFVEQIHHYLRNVRNE